MLYVVIGRVTHKTKYILRHVVHLGFGSITLAVSRCLRQIYLTLVCLDSYLCCMATAVLLLIDELGSVVHADIEFISCLQYHWSWLLTLPCFSGSETLFSFAETIEGAVRLDGLAPFGFSPEEAREWWQVTDAPHGQFKTLVQFFKAKVSVFKD